MESGHRKVNDWINGFMQLYDNTEPPTNYLRWTAISLIASALQRKCSLTWHKPIYPNLYILLVGPPASRKSTALDYGRVFISNIRDIKTSSDCGSTRALMSELEKARQISICEGYQIIHNSLTIYSSEFDVYLSRDNRDFLRLLTDWYDCKDDWSYKTEHSGSNLIDGVWLNVLGCVTPQVLQSSVGAETIGLGFASRVIFIWATKKQRWIPFPWLTQADQKLQEDLSYDYNRMNMLNGTFKVSEDFLDYYGEWYPNQENYNAVADSRFAYYNERRAWHLLKLSMIMSASRSDSMEITAADFQRGLAFLEDVEKFMPQVFAGVGKNIQAGIMHQIIQEIKQNGKIKESELLKIHCNDVNADELQGIITTLEKMMFINKPIIQGTDRLIIIKNTKDLNGNIL